MCQEKLAEAIQQHSSGNLDAAEALYCELLDGGLLHAMALNLLGVIAQQRGEIARAVELGWAAVDRDDELAEAHSNLGDAWVAADDLQQAIACYRRALVIEPRFVDARYNLGVALKRAGKLDDALACWKSVLYEAPEHASAANILANTLREVGRCDEAIALLRELIGRVPDYAEAHNNLGVALDSKGRLADALKSYSEAVRLKPSYAEAWLNLGTALKDAGRRDAALACFHKALSCRPDFSAARDQLYEQLRHACDWEAIEVLQERRDGSGDGEHTPGYLPFTMLGSSNSAAVQQHTARQWVRERLSRFDDSRQRIGFSFARAKARLTIGYLSRDFRNHPVAQLSAELFERHDRSAFNVFAYSYGASDGSRLRRRLEQSFDQFIDITDLSFEQAARRIHEDGVDILVDLTGYTTGGRTEILALRPAPIQVNYLGFAGTMGAPFIDYALTDSFLTPPEIERHFDEKLVYMPHSFQVNDSTRSVGEEMLTRTDCGLPEEGFVFCSFNSPYKITPDVFAIWMRLLLEVPGSVLWLRDVDPFAKANLAKYAVAGGVDASRLVYAGTWPHPQHLARYRVADLFLDTFPYNAHTTASDALWAGLPVLTRAGATYASRVAGSLLTALGLKELITWDASGYEQAALGLARNADEMRNVRHRLRTALPSAPLFSGARFARDLERAYREMWELFVAGEPPRRIVVDELPMPNKPRFDGSRG